MHAVLRVESVQDRNRHPESPASDAASRCAGALGNLAAWLERIYAGQQRHGEEYDVQYFQWQVSDLGASLGGSAPSGAALDLPDRFREAASPTTS